MILAVQAGGALGSSWDHPPFNRDFWEKFQAFQIPLPKMATPPDPSNLLIWDLRAAAGMGGSREHLIQG